MLSSFRRVCGIIGVDFSIADNVRQPDGLPLLMGLLFVSFTERSGGTLHLISARTVTQKERRDYEENLHA